MNIIAVGVFKFDLMFVSFMSKNSSDVGDKISKSNSWSIFISMSLNSLRVYELFMGPIDAAKPWDPNGIDGSKKFLDRVWRLFAESDKIQDCENKNLEKIYNYTVKKVTNDYETMNFNTAISQMMIFINTAYKENTLPREYAEGFLKLLNPVAPHITEELWEILGHNNTISYEPWPTYDEEKCKEDEFNLPIQVNGKLRSTLKIAYDTDENVIKEKAHEAVSNYINNKTIIKEIYVKNKIYNIVIK